MVALMLLFISRGEEQRAEERDKERHRALQCCEVLSFSFW